MSSGCRITRKFLLFFAMTMALGCGPGEMDEDLAAQEPISLDSIKADRLGNRRIDRFGGVLHFDDQAHLAAIEAPYYKVGFTFRAVARNEFKLWARDAQLGGSLHTTIRLYGPKGRDGRYPYIKRSDPIDAPIGRTSVLYYRPARAGIYLAVLTARARGLARIGLACGGGGEVSCELPCRIPDYYDPQCGADGVTYENRPAAACYDVPIVRPGACGDAPTCDGVRCDPGTHCELVPVVCITTPCYPVPQCVPDATCTGPKAYNPETGRCECTVSRVCITGFSWNPETCECESPCATLQCEAGTHCEVIGNAVACVPDAQPGPCIRTGCSGQICSDRDVVTTCEYRPEYACYRNARCERQADGRCGWTMTPALRACLANPPASF